MHGGNDDEGQVSKKSGVREKQTLIPVTVKIFNDTTVNNSDQLEYQNILLQEV